MKLTNFIYSWKFFKLDLFENEISNKKNFIYLLFDEEFGEESFNYLYRDFENMLYNELFPLHYPKKKKSYIIFHKIKKLK